MIIPYARHEVTDDDVRTVTDALRSEQLTGGKYVAEFEESFSKHVQTVHSLAVSSGTAGLHLAVAALGVPAGKKVLVPSLTFAATVNSALYCDAQIEFIDIDPDTLLIDLNEVKSKIKAKPHAYSGIIVVDFAGFAIDVFALRQICDKYGIWIVEDAAHALDATLKTEAITEKVGSSHYADITVFSFHPAKHITTGEGGMVTTQNTTLFERMKLLRSHSMDRSTNKSLTKSWYYEIASLGYNYRMSDINAALGISQLKRATTNVKRRQSLARRYTTLLADTNLVLPTVSVYENHAYHLYIIRSEKRDQLYDFLKQRGIFAQVHYTPLHRQPLYESFDGAQDLPHTDSYFATCLSIPLFPSLKHDEQDYVVAAIKDFL